METPMTVQRPTLLGPLALLREACLFYARHWQILVTISLIPAIASLPFFFISKGPKGLWIALSVVSFLIDFISKLAFLQTVTENGEPQGGLGGAFKKGLGLFFPFLWVSLLSGFATIGGMIVFVIPGLMLALWLSVSAYALFAENRRGMQALTASWHYVKGYWWALFGRMLVLMIVLGLVGILLGFLTGGSEILLAFKGGGALASPPSVPQQIIQGLWKNLLFVPLSLIFSYLIYRGLKEIKPEPAPEADEARRKKWLVAFAVIGLAGVIFLFVSSAAALKNFIKGAQMQLPPQGIEIQEGSDGV